MFSGEKKSHNTQNQTQEPRSGGFQEHIKPELFKCGCIMWFLSSFSINLSSDKCLPLASCICNHYGKKNLHEISKFVKTEKMFSLYIYVYIF